MICPIRMGKQKAPKRHGQQHASKQSYNPFRQCPVGTSNAVATLVSAPPPATINGSSAIVAGGVGYGTVKSSINIQ